MDDNSLSHIHLTKDEMLKPCNWKGNLDLLNIVLIGITNEIPEHDEKYEMHRLIGALLSSELKEQEKLDIIEHEYNIPISQEFREDVSISSPPYRNAIPASPKAIRIDCATFTII